MAYGQRTVDNAPDKVCHLALCGCESMDNWLAARCWTQEVWLCCRVPAWQTAYTWPQMTR